MGVGLGLLALSNVLILIPAGVAIRSAGSALLFCFLPGALFVAWLLASADARKQPVPLIETILLGSAASCLFTTMVTLLLSYLPMPLELHVLLISMDIITAGLLYLNYRQRVRWRELTLPTSPAELIPFIVLIVIILLAILVRFGHLGYAEYLGDEADVVYRARQLILGNLDELFVQRKGPVQIMVTAAFALGTNSFNELALRFPFALTSVLSIAGVYLLGKLIWNRRIGLIAAAVLSIDGIAIGFSRLVQYQGIVLLTLTLIVYCLCRMAAEAKTDNAAPLRRGCLSTRYLSLALGLLGLALLTHYETAMIVLPMAMILYPQWTQRTATGSPFYRAHRAELFVSTLIVLALLLIFYVPFVLHPHFGDTYDVYTYNRIGFGRGEPFNNIARYKESSIFYNSVYYVGGVALLWVLGTVRILRDSLTERKVLAYLAVLLVVVGVVISILAPDSLTIGERSVAFLFFVPALLLTIPAFSTGMELQRAILAWLYVNYMAYAFFIRVPGLHYYTMAPAAALVAAAGLDWLCGGMAQPIRPAQQRTPWRAWAVIVAVFAVMAGYPYMVFVRTDPAYAIDFPQHKSNLYWTPQNEMPEGGFFGFPRNSGWKVLPVLFRQGELHGSYMSNKKQIKPEWTYMRNPVDAEENPRYFFYDTLSARLTQQEKYPQEWVEENFELVGHIRVSGNERIRIYERPDGGSPSALGTYDAETYTPLFEQIDWLSEYRQEVLTGLDEADVAQVASFLEAQGNRPAIVLVNDPILQDALNYHYGGAETAVIPREPNLAQLLASGTTAEGTPAIWVIVWNGVNEPWTAEAVQWLSENFDRIAETTFGNLSVVGFAPKE